MNGYVRAAVAVPCGYVKLGLTKLFHIRDVVFGVLPRVSPYTEISVDKGAGLRIGKRFNMRGGARLRIRENAKVEIKDNVSIGINCMIAAHERITIGDNVQLSPNVQIYDHDHDFSAPGGVSSGLYKTSAVAIGNNVWVGANTTILRGTYIGDNAVIGAGSVVKGKVPANCVYIQKRDIEIKEINSFT